MAREPAPSERSSPWYLTRAQIENSPSRKFMVEKCNGDVEKARDRETQQRRLTCAFIQESGQKLRLPQLTIASAIVFYHRFFAYKSYGDFERFSIATTCIFLASKVEETPKKLKDVVMETYKQQHKDKPPPEIESREFWELKEKVLISERILLQTLSFDLTVEHAYRPLLAYVKSIKGTRDLAQVAWNFINDSLRTTICLQYAPRCVSAAAVHLAARYLSEKGKSEFALPAHQGGKWYDAFQVSEESFTDVAQQIMELYDNKGTGTGAGLQAGVAVALMCQRQLESSGKSPAGATPAAAPAVAAEALAPVAAPSAAAPTLAAEAARAAAAAASAPAGAASASPAGAAAADASPANPPAAPAAAESMQTETAEGKAGSGEPASKRPRETY